MRLLEANEIECKVKQINDKGCLILLYKTARVDMAILDEEFGAENWQSDYKVVNNNLYCGIGVFKNNQWVWKWDCGIESKEDGEGNEKKGEASDAFKRAGFKWGIGRELYTTPFIWVKAEIELKNGKYVLKNKYEKFDVDFISYNEDREIKELRIKDSKGNIVYSLNNKATTKDVLDAFDGAKVVNNNLQEEIKQYIQEKQYINVNALQVYNYMKKNNFVSKNQEDLTKPGVYKKLIDWFEKNNKKGE